MSRPIKNTTQLTVFILTLLVVVCRGAQAPTTSFLEKYNELEPLQLHSDSLLACQFWLNNTWYNLNPLQASGGYYAATNSSNPYEFIDFNFCASLVNSGGVCN